MKFGINQSISQTITQLSCIQLETPSSRLWNFWWIKTYTTFNLCPFQHLVYVDVLYWIVGTAQFMNCLEQDCSISIANAIDTTWPPQYTFCILEQLPPILMSCTEL